MMTFGQKIVLVRCLKMGAAELQRRILDGDEDVRLTELAATYKAYFAALHALLGHDRVPIAAWETYKMIEYRQTEEVDGHLYRKNTNYWRAAKANQAKRQQRNASLERSQERGGWSALQRFALRNDERTRELCEKALVEVEQRLLRIQGMPPNARARKKERWLGRWAQRINAELEAQEKT